MARNDMTITGVRRYAYPVTTKLYVLECARCGVVYGIPDDLDNRARANRDISFYCPNGHTQHYPGLTAEEKANRRAKEAEARATALRDQLQAAERSKAAIKGHLTRARKRGGAGVCPVEGCRRHFAQVERHIASKHPGFLESLGNQEARQ
jgi:hypothetical protein